MDLQDEKCVMLIDEYLPLRIITNTVVLMGITLGKEQGYFVVIGRDIWYTFDIAKK